MPVVRILVLVFALAHAAGVLDALEVTCAADCDEDERGSHGCTPMCATCQCARCPSVVPTAAAVAPPPPPPPRVDGFAEIEQAPACPDPREILHVPIARPV